MSWHCLRLRLETLAQVGGAMLAAYFISSSSHFLSCPFLYTLPSLPLPPFSFPPLLSFPVMCCLLPSSPFPSSLFLFPPLSDSNSVCHWPLCVGEEEDLELLIFLLLSPKAAISSVSCHTKHTFKSLLYILLYLFFFNLWISESHLILVTLCLVYAWEIKELARAKWSHHYLKYIISKITQSSASSS